MPQFYPTKEKSTATVRSFVFFCNEMLDQPYKGMFVDHHLYVFNILMKAIDTRMHACVTPEVSLSLNLVRNRIFRETLLSGRIFLAMFFLTAFPPFNNILRFSWFRSHFDRLGSVIRSLTLRKWDLLESLYPWTERELLYNVWTDRRHLFI